MEKYERHNRIGEALSLRNMKQVELAEKGKFNRGTVSNWIKNKYQPKQNAIAVMAQILDVAELWLAGYDIPMERAPEQKKADALIELFNRLRSDEELKQLVYNIIDLDENNYQMIKSLVSQLVETKK